MGVISRAIDRLPTWAQEILTVMLVIASIYSIAHYGFFSFLMHLIFSPDL
jgi:hypothetical protein